MSAGFWDGKSEEEWSEVWRRERLREDEMLAFHDAAGGRLTQKALAEKFDLKPARVSLLVRRHVEARERRQMLAQNAELVAALEDFIKWSEAYPTTIFIEPDYEKAHALLQAGGMTLDAISAGVLREATKEMGKRARAALAAAGQGSGK